MKAERRTRLMAVLLGTLGAVGSIGVFASGMGFSDVSIKTLALVCLGSAAVAALLGDRKLFWLFPLGTVCLCLLGRDRLGLERSLEALIYYVSKLYDLGYGWGTLRWSGETLLMAQAGPVLWILGGLAAVTIARGCLRGKPAAPVTAVMAGLVPCMALTDTVPEEKFLFIQLLCVAVLLLSGREPRRGIWLAMPVALAVGVLFAAMPREEYAGQELAEKVGKHLEEIFTLEKPQQTEEPDQPLLPDLPDTGADDVNLSLVGPKTSWKIPVMEVTAQETGILYLRGLSYDYYGGTWWGEDEEDGAFGQFTSQGDPLMLSLSTRQVHDVLYAPYGIQSVTRDGVVISYDPKGRVDNPDRLKEYKISYVPVDYSEVANVEANAFLWSDRLSGDADYGAFLDPDMMVSTQFSSAFSRYLQLDEDTRRRAEDLLIRELPELGQMETEWAKAQAIRDLVKASAAYSLSTRRMPSGEDFAMWFLESSDTGYCVHFASAAVVLLRAAGLPARYVTGYLASAAADRTVTVTQENSHAWAEVFIQGAGWVLLEPTPAGGVESTANPENTQPSETTQTERPAESTPEQTTQPEETDPENSVPSESQGTSQQGGAEAPGMKEPSVLPGWAKVLLWTGAALAAVVVQWRLRVALRKGKRATGSTNAQVLAMWQEAELCRKLLKEAPEEEFLRLAQKARFSQHTLTREERNQCQTLLQAEKSRLKLRKDLRTALGAVVFALY